MLHQAKSNRHMHTPVQGLLHPAQTKHTQTHTDIAQILRHLMVKQLQHTYDMTQATVISEIQSGWAGGWVGGNAHQLRANTFRNDDQY
jgi:hypothetical protein